MNHTRHSNIYDASRLSVTIVGAGGLGATTALCLAKMGIPMMTLIDDDVVSEVNMPTQLHKIASLGQDKAQAVAEMISEFSDDLVVLDPIVARVTGDVPLSDQIVVSCVDSIKARQDIWKVVKAGPTTLYLEARMGAEEFQLHCVDPTNAEWYDKYISSQSDDDVPDLPCTSKATIYTAFLAAAMIGSAVRKFITGDQLAHKIMLDMVSNTLMEM